MRRLVTSLTAFALALALAALGTVPSGAHAQDATSQKAVLVTGASSGIGLRITEVLAAKGHFVYAGARKEKDLASLDALDNVKAVRLDVTRPEEIDAAVAMIRKAGRGLHGVVNNAGVGLYKSMAEATPDDIDFVFGVNVYGPYRINNAFMPLLMESNGRTLTIGSIAGFIAGPNGGTYSMSKFAVEAYTDSLAAETRDSGVHVAIVEPGSYKSRIREKVTMHRLGKGYRQGEATTEEEKTALEQAITRNEGLKDPDEVANVVVDALFGDNPRRRYMVVPSQEQADITLRSAMRRVVQLNEGQPYEYSRDELVALLDKLLGGED